MYYIIYRISIKLISILKGRILTTEKSIFLLNTKDNIPFLFQIHAILSRSAHSPFWLLGNVEFIQAGLPRYL